MEADTIKYMKIGVVGLGLMGSSIVVSLLAAGHQVVALAPVKGEKDTAAKHLADLLQHADQVGLLSRGLASSFDRLRLTEDYRELAGCHFVQECVIEDKSIKSAVYEKIAASVAKSAIIASNTSAIPISELQQFVPNPERFLGIHWAEPAYMTRFLEITCGELTNIEIAEYVMTLGKAWGKEPTLLKKDIRGFITNRLMYAVYREALTLIEHGEVSIEAVDKGFRYDVGSWITLMGVFRRMDFLGLKDYVTSFDPIFEKLSNRSDVPAIMQKMVDEHAKGIHNCVGLYEYDEELAKSWKDAFESFNKDIYELASKYNEQQITELIEKHTV